MNVKTKRNQQKCKDDKKTDECDVDRCKKLAVDARLKNRLYNRFKHWSYEIPLYSTFKTSMASSEGNIDQAFHAPNLHLS